MRALPKAAGLSPIRRIDHLPEILDRIADLANKENVDPAQSLTTGPDQHAIERLDEGFDIGEVLAEYTLLRRIVLTHWEREVVGGLHPDSVVALDRAFDHAIATSVSRFTRARDRTLLGLDRILTAAAEQEVEVEGFLRRLLRVLAETTEAVDSVSILIREGDVLRVRASIGLEATENLTVRIGEGFSGKIAATGRPVELRDAANDRLIADHALIAVRERGVRALYGVPLLRGREVIGVAHMGSTTAHEFSHEDKVLFRKHWIDWINNTPFLRGLLVPLQPAIEKFEEALRAALAKVDTPEFTTIESVAPATREEAAALYLAGIRAILDLDFTDGNATPGYVIAFVTCSYEPERGHAAKYSEIAEAMRDVAVQGLYEYIDEQIDERTAVLGLLVKYKHRCEWYRRQRLRSAATDGDGEGRTGEKALACDLYEYIHDQGVDFWVESKSASGEPDLVTEAVDGRRLIADAKYITSDMDSSVVRQTLIKGFRQVFDYCRDYNEPVGYLVVFVDQDVTIDLPGERDDGFPCYRLGGNTVYYVIVDIHGHSKTASKRPRPKVIGIAPDDLKRDLEATGGTTPT